MCFSRILLKVKEQIQLPFFPADTKLINATVGFREEAAIPIQNTGYSNAGIYPVQPIEY